MTECNHKYEFLESWNVLVCANCGDQFEFRQSPDDNDAIVSLVEAKIEEEDGVIWEEFKL